MSTLEDRRDSPRVRLPDHSDIPWWIVVGANAVMFFAFGAWINLAAALALGNALAIQRWVP